jgi:hypothetical protein
MRVRYNPAVGVLFLVLGAVCSFLGLWLLLLGEFSPALFVGLVPMLLGVLHLVRPYFWMSPGSLTLPSVIGPARREVTFQSLEVEGGRLFGVQADGSRKKLPVARWMAHSGDWTAATEGAVHPGR